MKPEDNSGGGSDDIGDVSWTVPTVTLRYPANIPGMPGHNWASAIAEATPVAHKGVTAGAKVEAMTAHRPAAEAGDWCSRPGTTSGPCRAKGVDLPAVPGSQSDKPAIWLNEKLMRQLRPEMKTFYYDPSKYKTYLEQLGIPYPPPDAK